MTVEEWIISTKVKLNTFLVFGIDHRVFLEGNKATEKQINTAISRIDKFIDLYERFGKCVFPQYFQKQIDYDGLKEMRNSFLNEENRKKQAINADIIILEYLSDILGPLVIKKEISTSLKITCCDELGISEAVFDHYVCYREIRDTNKKIYPYYFCS